MPYAQRINPAFSEKFNIVHWDQRASGLSFEKTKNLPLLVDGYTSDLKIILKKVRSEFPKSKIIVVAASWGSLIGLKVAFSNPELLDYYVGVGQMILPLKALRQAYASLKSSGLKELSELGPPPWKVNDFFRFVSLASRAENYPNRISHEHMNEFARESPFYRSVGIGVIEEGQVVSFRGLISQIYAFDATAEIGGLKVPQLFLQGEHDWVTPTGLVRDFISKHSTSAQASLIELKGYGHNLLLEAPDAVARAISDFL